MEVQGVSLKGNIIDGKLLAERINQETCKIIKEKKILAGLAAILVGNDKASELYVTLKERACE